MATKVSLPPPQGGYQVVGNPPSSAYEGYKQSTNNFTRPPDYPDTSYGTYLKSGGSFPGFGYYAWRDKLVSDYNTAYELYKNWYESAPNQVAQLNAAGLNTNLAYGQVSPGGASFSPRSPGGSPDIAQVFGTGASILTALVGNVKGLAEAATIITQLPDSKFKSKLAKQLDVAAAAGAINSEHGYIQQLNNARNVLGVGTSKATQEKANSNYQAALDAANQVTLDYMTSHSADGSPSDLEGSIFLRGKTIGIESDILAYQKNKVEFDSLFSKPEYFKAVLDKMVNEAIISKGQAYTVQTIINDPNLDPQSKALMLQGGLPGFLAKLAGMTTSNVIDLGSGIGKGIKWLGNDIKTGASKAGAGLKKGFQKIKNSNWKPRGRGYDPDDFTD